MSQSPAPDALVGFRPALRERLAEAEASRRAWRPAEMRFDTLAETRAVSVTGSACDLDCAHCGGHYLRGMMTPSQARRVAGVGGAASGGGFSGSGRRGTRPVRSWLVSGGCDRDGRVPLLRNESLLAELARKDRLNLHTGLVRTEEEAQAIARHARVVSLDFVVDGPTIQEVYGFSGVTGHDFVRSYALLAPRVAVWPHVVIGLAGGEIRGEMAALRELVRLGARGVTLLVFIPTEGSRFAHLAPPPLSEVAQVLAEARLLWPNLPVQLGCMRPKGAYRSALDRLAVRAGIDRIAVPTPGAVREAEALGFRPVWSAECCAFPS